MNSNIFSYFFNELRKRTIREKVVVLFVCLFLATFFWLLSALSKKHNSTITFPIEYTEISGDKIVSRDLPEYLNVNLDGYGFTLLGFHYGQTLKPITIQLNNYFGGLSRSRKRVSESTIPTSLFLDEIYSQLPSNIRISSIKPDSIRIYIENKSKRKLKLRFTSPMSFEKQFGLSDKIKISPEELNVYGPASILDTIEYLCLDSLNLGSLKSSVQTKVKVLLPKYVKSTLKEVDLYIPVEQQTEKNLSVMVNAICDPSVLAKLFPSRVDMKVMVPLSRFDKIDAESFNLYVKLDTSIVRKANKLKVQVAKQPEWVTIQRIIPEKVEYVLRIND